MEVDCGLLLSSAFTQYLSPNTYNAIFVTLKESLHKLLTVAETLSAGQNGKKMIVILKLISPSSTEFSFYPHPLP